MVVQLTEHHLLKRLPLLHCIASVPWSKINCPCFCGLFMDSLLFYVSICLSLHQYSTVFPVVALFGFPVKCSPTCAFFFFFKSVFDILSPMLFYKNFKLAFWLTHMRPKPNFYLFGIALILYINCGKFSL